jgi:hypothetical protein
MLHQIRVRLSSVPPDEIGAAVTESAEDINYQLHIKVQPKPKCPTAGIPIG